MSGTDEGKPVIGGVELEKYRRDEYPSLELLFQFVVESYEEFLENTYFLRIFEEKFGKERNGKAGLYPMSGRIAYVEYRFVSFFVVPEGISDDFVFSEDFPEEIESMDREILDIFGKSAMHDREKLVAGIVIGHILYRP